MSDYKQQQAPNSNNEEILNSFLDKVITTHKKNLKST